MWSKSDDSNCEFRRYLFYLCFIKVSCVASSITSLTEVTKKNWIKNLFMLHRTHHNSSIRSLVFLSYLRFYTYSPFIKIFIIFCGFLAMWLEFLFNFLLSPSSILSLLHLSFGVEIDISIWRFRRLLPHIPMTAFHASSDT